MEDKHRAGAPRPEETGVTPRLEELSPGRVDAVGEVRSLSFRAVACWREDLTLSGALPRWGAA
jgi:hypothetical protein